MEDINHRYQIADMLDTYDFAWSGFDVLLHHYVAKSNDFTNVPAYTARTDLAVMLIQNALPGWRWRCYPFSGEELIERHTVEKPVTSMVVAWYATETFDVDHCEFTDVHVDLQTTWAVMLLKGMLQLKDRLNYNS